jgi:hypothetical protein
LYYRTSTSTSTSTVLCSNLDDSGSGTVLVLPYLDRYYWKASSAGVVRVAAHRWRWLTFASRPMPSCRCFYPPVHVPRYCCCCCLRLLLLNVAVGAWFFGLPDPLACLSIPDASSYRPSLAFPLHRNPPHPRCFHLWPRNLHPKCLHPSISSCR